MAIKVGDKLIWRERGAEIPVEAASNETDGTVQIKNKGTIATVDVTTVRPIDDES